MTEYHNVLDNPSLAADLNRIREYHKAGDDAQLVYSATGWMDTYVADLRPDSLNEIMGSLNVPSVVPDAGFMHIRASYKSFLVRFKKMGVPVKAGQKYLLKLTAWPKLRFHNEGGDLSTVRVRGVLEVNNIAYPLQWKSFDAWMAEAPQELVWSVQTHNSTLVTLSWEVWSVWGNIVGDIAIEKLEMLEIGSDWQGIDLEIGKPGVDPTPIPVPVPVPTPVPAASNALTWILGIGLALAIVLVLFVVLRSNTAASAQAVGTPNTLEQAAQMLLAAIVAIVMGAASVPVVTPLTNFVKWLTLKVGLNVSADHILLGVSALVTVAVWVAGRVGLGLQLDSVFAILVTVLPILTQLLTSIFGSKALYAAAVSAQVAGFGYQRTA